MQDIVMIGFGARSFRTLAALRTGDELKNDDIRDHALDPRAFQHLYPVNFLRHDDFPAATANANSHIGYVALANLRKYAVILTKHAIRGRNMRNLGFAILLALLVSLLTACGGGSGGGGSELPQEHESVEEDPSEVEEPEPPVANPPESDEPEPPEANPPEGEEPEPPEANPPESDEPEPPETTPPQAEEPELPEPPSFAVPEVSVTVLEETLATGYSATAEFLPLDPAAYSLAGADQALFIIEPNLGHLSFIDPPFFSPDVDNAYEIDVIATNAGGTATQSVTVNVERRLFIEMVFPPPAANLGGVDDMTVVFVAVDRQGDPVEPGDATVNGSLATPSGAHPQHMSALVPVELGSGTFVVTVTDALGGR